MWHEMFFVPKKNCVSTIRSMFALLQFLTSSIDPFQMQKNINDIFPT